MNFDHKVFFNSFRSFYKKHTGKNLSVKIVKEVEFLLTSFENESKWNDYRHIAYAFATIAHETAWSFEPVEEGFYLGNASRVKRFQKTLKYYPYFGRGYVQLTWEGPKIFNYSKASKALGVDFVNNPELTLEREHSFNILTRGMHEGWFTGKKLRDYINDKIKDYKNARRIINGVDKASLIAGYAVEFEIMLAEAKIKNKPNNYETKQEISKSEVSDSSSTTIEVKDGDIKVESTDTTGITEKEKIAIEKPEGQGFGTTIRNKIAALTGGNMGLDVITEKLAQAQALGLSPGFWKKVAYFAIAGSIIYLMFLAYKHYTDNKKQLELTNELIKANTTDNNFIQLISKEQIEEYKNKGYKVITR